MRFTNWKERSEMKSRFLSSTLAVLVLGSLGLSACSWFDSDNKTPLPGPRISVLELQKNRELAPTTKPSAPLLLPAPWGNEYWPQSGGYPNHSLQNLTLSPNPLSKKWSVSIGTGSTSTLPLTAQPVVFDGLVYTLDTQSQVSAFDIKTGRKIWQNTIRPKGEDEQVIGGGLASSGAILYATNGYNELLAMNPKEGGIFWRKKLSSPSRAAPAILDDRVFVLTLDNRLLALNAADGTLLWDYQGLSEVAGLVGAAAPAVSSEIALSPMSSGELVALRVQNGSVAWGDNLSPTVKVGGLGALPDIRALPILDKGRVIAVSYSGKMVAIDERTGSRVWQKDIGSASTPWVAGDQIFVISSNDELVALSRESGDVLWVKPLSDYMKKKDHQNALLWNGPLLAGGRLILSAPEGNILEIDPQNGTLLRQLATGRSVAVSPVVAANTLLLLQDDGTLSAYQ